MIDYNLNLTSVQVPNMLRVCLIFNLWIAVSCLWCDPNCNTCLVVCLSCQPGYYSSGTSCYSCPQNCKTCSSANQCSSCAEGNYLSKQLCYTCVPNCSSCDSEQKCTKCLDVNYTLINGACKSSNPPAANSSNNDKSKNSSNADSANNSNKPINNSTADASKNNTDSLSKDSNSQNETIKNNIYISSSSNGNQQLVIEILVALGVFFKIIIIILGCYCCKRCRRERIQTQRRNNLSETQNNSQNQITYVQIFQNPQSRWLYIRQRNRVNQKICSICQHQIVDFQINCSHRFHSYHYKCLNEWFIRNRNRICPNACPNISYPIKYCDKCHQRGKAINWTIFTKYKIFSIEEKTCDICHPRYFNRIDYIPEI